MYCKTFKICFEFTSEVEASPHETQPFTHDNHHDNHLGITWSLYLFVWLLTLSLSFTSGVFFGPSLLSLCSNLLKFRIILDLCSISCNSTILGPNECPLSQNHGFQSDVLCLFYLLTQTGPSSVEIRQIISGRFGSGMGGFNVWPKTKRSVLTPSKSTTYYEVP